jgi:hypothetical protein
MNAAQKDDDRNMTARFDIGVLALFQPNMNLPDGIEAASVSTPCRVVAIRFSEAAVRYDIDVLLTESGEETRTRLTGIPSLMIRRTLHLAGKVEQGGDEQPAATEKCMQMELSDGSKWNVPVSIIARSRATYYAQREYGGDVELSLADDTLPLFKDDAYAIEDWAVNNMNWSDVKHAAYQVAEGSIDMQDEWCNCEKTIVFAPVRA